MADEGLDQPQFDGPFDRRSATVDIEFAVNTFGVSSQGAQGDDQFIRDFRPGQFRFEQTENFQLALAERFDEALWGGECGRER